MLLITRLFIKTAFLFFMAALLCGLLLALRPIMETPRLFSGLTPVYFHLFMVGWVTHIIIGVAYWMFPKSSKKSPRGLAILAWSTYLLLNIGLLLRIFAEPAHLVQTRQIWGQLLATSAALQWLGGLTFVINTGRGLKCAKMPRLSVWLIRSAIIYLLAGFTLGI